MHKLDEIVVCFDRESLPNTDKFIMSLCMKYIGSAI